VRRGACMLLGTWLPVDRSAWTRFEPLGPLHSSRVAFGSATYKEKSCEVVAYDSVRCTRCTAMSSRPTQSKTWLFVRARELS